jgi:hypothetical protein
MIKQALVMAVAAALVSAPVWAGCGSCPGDKPAAKKAEAGCKVAAKPSVGCKAGDTVYACSHCAVVDVKAGKCEKCKAELAAMHVLSMKDGKVSLCPCATGCACTLKADDPKQCSCGKAVVTMECAKACQAVKACDATPGKACPLP